MSLLNKTKGNIFFVKKIVYRHFKFFFFFNKFLRKSISQNIQNRWEKKTEKSLKRQKPKKKTRKRKIDTKEENDKPCAFYTLVL